MNTILIKTKKTKEVLDITDIIEQHLRQQEIEFGTCHLFLPHTTAALTTADLDPGTDLDMLDAFKRLIPKLNWRHPHNPSHVPAHILSSLIGTSLAIPFQNKKLNLGTWQRIVLIEFDGPKERQIIISLK